MNRMTSNLEPEILFGLALRLSAQPEPGYSQHTHGLMEIAASRGYIPAQYIWGQFLKAHNRPIPSPTVLRVWEQRAMETGSHLPPTYLSIEEAEVAKNLFRENGGHCGKQFLSFRNKIDATYSLSKFRESTTGEELATKVDLEGNTIMHLLAGLGRTRELSQNLGASRGTLLNATNDNGETSLYKACQAGQMTVLQLFRDLRVDLADFATIKEGMIALHWLFMFKDGDLTEACSYLAGANSKNINKQMAPDGNSSGKNHFSVVH
jgi:hypothetical protein